MILNDLFLGTEDFTEVPAPSYAEKGVVLFSVRGPIIDYSKQTRTGRQYSEELWSNVMNSDYFKELIMNRVFLGESDHPCNNEYQDQQMIIKSISHAFRDVVMDRENGKIIATVDILNTEAGRNVNTLYRYGCRLGYSSRGMGEQIPNTIDVNPNTYRFITVDIVVMPSNEAARPFNPVWAHVNDQENKHRNMNKGRAGIAYSDAQNESSVLDRLYQGKSLLECFSDAKKEVNDKYVNEAFQVISKLTANEDIKKMLSESQVDEKIRLSQLENLLESKIRQTDQKLKDIDQLSESLNKINPQDDAVILDKVQESFEADQGETALFNKKELIAINEALSNNHCYRAIIATQSQLINKLQESDTEQERVLLGLDKLYDSFQSHQSYLKSIWDLDKDIDTLVKRYESLSKAYKEKEMKNESSKECLYRKIQESQALKSELEQHAENHKQMRESLLELDNEFTLYQSSVEQEIRDLKTKNDELLESINHHQSSQEEMQRNLEDQEALRESLESEKQEILIDYARRLCKHYKIQNSRAILESITGELNLSIINESIESVVREMDALPIDVPERNSNHVREIKPRSNPNVTKRMQESNAIAYTRPAGQKTGYNMNLSFLDSIGEY